MISNTPENGTKELFAQKDHLTRPCYIIAEAGVNHNGSIELAKRLILAAKESGADAVKFQTFKTEEVVSLQAEKAPYQIDTTGNSESQYDMIKALELSEDEFYELKKYAEENEITFLSTPFDHQSVDFLDNLGVPFFKIPSGEITNIPLLEHIGQKKKPLILSTGMSTLGEVEEAISVLKNSGSSDIILLHCTTSYPAPIDSVNLAAIETLRCAFRLPVGYSDHTKGIAVPIAAAALGATVIEKHFTLNKNMPGPDHKASLEPDELAAMVKGIRDVEMAMGDGVKVPNSVEKENMRIARKSLVAKRDIKAGEILNEDSIAIKRPGNGISPKYFDVVNKMCAIIDIKKDDVLIWSHLNNKLR